MSFEGKIVLVTGAAGNLGRAVAEAFAERRATLVLMGRDEKGLEGVAAQALGRRLLLGADLFDADAVGRAVEKALSAYGRIDVLCNIAGGFWMGPPVHETPEDKWRLMLDLNAGTVLTMARAVVPSMLAAGSGKVVNVASMGGLHGSAAMGAYAAAKSAVIRLTESMAEELRHKGINVNCILPSIIDTPQNRASMPGADHGRWLAPEALADVVLFLASDAARAVHGAAIPVVGLS